MLLRVPRCAYFTSTGTGLYKIILEVDTKADSSNRGSTMLLKDFFLCFCVVLRFSRSNLWATLVLGVAAFAKC